MGSSFCLLCLDATCKVFLLWSSVLARTKHSPASAVHRQLLKYFESFLLDFQR